MKPNYEAMSKAELKAHVLEHRDDIEAIRLLFQIRDGVEVKCYPQAVKLMEPFSKVFLKRNKR